jgi:secretion/DNA translocation related CpaE-like protein
LWTRRAVVHSSIVGSPAAVVISDRGDMQRQPIIGVLSGCGGAGASVLAASIACSAGVPRPGRDSAGPAFLIDCDPLGGGIDVLLGCEQVSGPRWSQVELRGGQLDPAALLGGLPRWGTVSFLAADSALEPAPADALNLIDAAVTVGPVVLDLPRWASPTRTALLARCDRVVLVCPAEVRAVTASALVAAALDPEVAGVAVRGVSRALPATRIGALLGLPLLGDVPYDPACLDAAGLRPGRLRRATRALSSRIVEGARVVAEAAA